MRHIEIVSAKYCFLFCLCIYEVKHSDDFLKA